MPSLSSTSRTGSPQMSLGWLGLSKSKVEVSKLLPKTNQNQKEETSKLKQFPTNMEVILPKGNKKVIKEKDSIEKPEA
jgi:hypothetical protein